MQPSSCRLVLFAIALIAVLFAFACSDTTGEAALVDANEKRSDAESQVAAAEERVRERKQDVAEAEQKLTEAEHELAAARVNLRDAESVVGQAATDDVLFRTVQKRLLADHDLEDVAVAARVHDSVATLTGSVPSRDLREHAVRVAAGTPGVTRVQNQIEIAVSSGPLSR